jgi:RNA polymerase sigma-70 factor (ECF subfamily)
MIFKKLHKAKEMDPENAASELTKGSIEAFNFLYEKYQNKAYWFCLRMLGDPESAKDAFQETFIKVYEKRKDFRGENFNAWLFTIARHICLNIIRARKEFDELEENSQINDSLRQSDIGMKEYIEAAMQKLPVAYREALILREYEECSYQEIADILGIELANAKVRVHRARTLMRKLLTPLAKEYYEH